MTGLDEDASIEFKRTVDLTSPKDRLELVKEIVGFANAGGGQIFVGVTDDGRRLGVSVTVANRFDPARICDLVDSRISPDHVEIEVTRTLLSEGDVVVRLSVPAFGRPPLVMARDGNYPDESGTQKTCFRKGDVWVRRGTKVERATRMDYIAWTEAAVDVTQERFLAGVQLLTTMPSDATVRVVRGDSDLDEPTSALSAGVRRFHRDPTSLLTATELAWLLLAAGRVDLDDDMRRLLIHSALRKRATFWHWVARTSPSPAWLRDVLHEAATGRDRDISDAGPAIVDVAALVLDEPDFNQVVAALAESRYSHFREAASDGGDHTTVLRRLRARREQPAGGVDLRELPEVELRRESVELAQVLLDNDRNTAVATRLSRLGFELCARTPVGHRLTDR